MATSDLPAATITSGHVTVRGARYLRYVVRYTEGQKRVRKVFATLADARRFAEQSDRDAKVAADRQAILPRRVGEDDAAKLSAEHLRDAIAALAKLAGRGTLTEAAGLFVRDVEARKREVPTVAELVQTYLAASEAAGLRERSMGDLRVRLARFAERFGGAKVNAVTAADAKGWLETLCPGTAGPCRH